MLLLASSCRICDRSTSSIALCLLRPRQQSICTMRQEMATMGPSAMIQIIDVSTFPSHPIPPMSSMSYARPAASEYLVGNTCGS